MPCKLVNILSLVLEIDYSAHLQDVLTKVMFISEFSYHNLVLYSMLELPLLAPGYFIIKSSRGLCRLLMDLVL